MQYEKGAESALAGETREFGLRADHSADRGVAAGVLRIVTMPIQSQGIITRDNVSVDISAVAYYRVDVHPPWWSHRARGRAINQIAQTTLRNVVGQHTRPGPG